MKFIKTYIPIIITVLFFLFMPFILGVMKMNNNFNSPKLEGLKSYINIISIILMVLIILETIICMIHSFKHKEIECHILLGIIILLFNVIIIPLYTLKYVVRAPKTKIKVLLLVILCFLAILIGSISNNILVDRYGYYSLENDITKNYLIDETNISMEIPVTYKKENNKAWNLYLFDYERGIEIGVKVIDLSKYNITPNEIIDLLALNIDSKKIVNEYSYDENIIKTYNVKYQEQKYIYKMNAFKYNDKYLICVVGITLEEDFNLYENEIDEIIKYISQQ